MKRYTRENRPSLTDEQIAELNEEFNRRFREYLATIPDNATSDDLEEWIREFEREVAARR